MTEKRPTPQDHWAALLAALAIGVGLLSFQWQARHPTMSWDGPLLLMLALLLAGMAWWRGRVPAVSTPRGEPGYQKPATPRPDPPRLNVGGFSLKRIPRWRLFIFGSAIFLTGLLLVRLHGPPRPDYLLDLVIWIAAILLYTLAVAPPVRRPREDWSLWWEINRRVLFTGAAILLVAGVARLWRLGTIPWTISGDEASHGIEAVRVIVHDLSNPFITSWMGMPTMDFFYTALGVRLFGATSWGIRLPWSLVGIATILTTFWLITRLRGLQLGLMTAALLAVMPYHIHFSRLGMNNIADPFFVTLSFLFLYRARDRGSPLDWALTGLSVGIAFFFYPGARFTALLVAACIGVMMAERRSDRAALRELAVGAAILVGAFLISAAPMLDYAARFPDEYNSRFNQVGILQNGWLESEPARRGTSTLNVLVDQLTRSAMAFNLFPDTTSSFGPTGPLLNGAWGALFLLGLLYSTLRLLLVQREMRLFPLVAWWWGIILTGGMLTDRPPASARLFGTAPVVCFFVAVAILRLVQLIQEGLLRRDQRLQAAIAGLLVAALGIQGLTWYFGPFQKTGNYGGRNGTLATALGYYVQAHPLAADQRLLFVGPPQMELKFSTIPFMIPEEARRGIDVWEPIVQVPTNQSLTLAEGERPFFVVPHWNAPTLDLIEQGYPGGQRQLINDERGDLFWIYAAP